MRHTEGVSFLDSLENNVNAMERREEKDPEQLKRDRERQEAERAAALRRAPYADALKNSAFTSQLLTECRTLGRQQRVLVQFTWLGERLRLHVNQGVEKRLELIPAEDGIAAVFQKDGAELARDIVKPETADAAALARRWLLEL